METKKFDQATTQVYNQIFEAIDALDPDEVEADESSDNVKITFGNGTVFVVNRQRPTSQIWLATKRNGYHFNYQEGTGSWVCDKTGAELFPLLAQEISEQLGQPFSF